MKRKFMWTAFLSMVDAQWIIIVELDTYFILLQTFINTNYVPGIRLFIQKYKGNIYRAEQKKQKGGPECLPGLRPTPILPRGWQKCSHTTGWPRHYFSSQYSLFFVKLKGLGSIAQECRVGRIGLSCLIIMMVNMILDSMLRLNSSSPVIRHILILGNIVT